MNARLPDGLHLSEARELLNTFGIERFKVAPKTWLDVQVAVGFLQTGKKDGRIAYWPGPSGWPAPDLSDALGWLPIQFHPK